MKILDNDVVILGPYKPTHTLEFIQANIDDLIADIAHFLQSGQAKGLLPKELEFAHIPLLPITINEGSQRSIIAIKEVEPHERLIAALIISSAQGCHITAKHLILKGLEGIETCKPRQYGYTPSIPFSEVLNRIFKVKDALSKPCSDMSEVDQTLIESGLQLPELEVQYARYFYGVAHGWDMKDHTQQNTQGPVLGCYTSALRWPHPTSEIYRDRFNLESSFDVGSLMCEAKRIIAYLVGDKDMILRRPRKRYIGRISREESK